MSWHDWVNLALQVVQVVLLYFVHNNTNGKNGGT